jgi:hypothetical protein
MENLQKDFSGERPLSERAVSGLHFTNGIYFAKRYFFRLRAIFATNRFVEVFSI